MSDKMFEAIIELVRQGGNAAVALAISYKATDLLICLVWALFIYKVVIVITKSVAEARKHEVITCVAKCLETGGIKKGVVDTIVNEIRWRIYDM